MIFCLRRCAMFWYGFCTSFHKFANFSFWDVVEFVLKLRSDLGTSRFLWIWFRNANQWYPITSWLEGFNPKVSGAWGWTPPNIKLFLDSSKSPILYEVWVQNEPYLMKLKIAKLSKFMQTPFQNIAHLLWPNNLESNNYTNIWYIQYLNDTNFYLNNIW